jgi:hypothetical protein
MIKTLSMIIKLFYYHGILSVINSERYVNSGAKKVP